MAYEEKFMRLALEQAKISFASGEVPIGCVITINNEVIAVEEIDALRKIHQHSMLK